MSEFKQKVQDYLKTVDEVIAQGPFTDTWESLVNYKVPAWYQNAKFGIFIHWGVYSVPAFGSEWYPRLVYMTPEVSPNPLDYFNHHRETYGEHKDFGYKDFVPMFKAEKFDPKEWVKLFKEAGARYIMPVAEHHDGFQMYDSELSDWTSTKMGPHRDIVGELKKEIEDEGLVFCASSHRIEHFFFMSPGKDFESDIPQNPEYAHIYWPSRPNEELDDEFMQDWLVRSCEIVDKYQPKVVFFDFGIQVPPMKPYLKKFAAYYYNRAAEWGVEVAINSKYEAYMHTSTVLDIERGQLSGCVPYFWQNDTSVARNSWSYTPDNDYKEATELICDLVDITAKNGTLLLNIGPKADGTIPEQDAGILREIGEWLSVNGEGIYDTKPWKEFGEGDTKIPEGAFTDTLRMKFTNEDYRFTCKPNTLYVFALNPSKDGVYNIKSLRDADRKFRVTIKNVEILGETEKCIYRRTNEHMVVIGEQPKDSKPVCIKISFE